MKAALLAIAAALYAASPWLGIPAWTPSVATVATFMALSLIGMNLVFGVAGMLAFGQAAIVALPGYVVGMLEIAGVPAVAAIPLGVIAAIAAARVVGEIFIRLPGVYFAIGTLGFSFVMEGIARAFPATTGGASGLVLSREIVLGETGWYGLALVALAASIACYALYLRGAVLRTLRQVRHDELAAEVLGIDVIRVKLRVFTIGSAFSAVGGVLLAHYVGVVVPESAGVIRSLEQLAMVVIGGAGSAAGPLVGAALVQWMFVVAGGAGRYEVLVYGAGFLVAVLFAPQGIVGLIRRGWAQIVPATRGATAASAVAAPATATTPRRGSALKVEDVSKNFGGLQAVDGVNLEVPFGTIVALIGPNGAGKTTLYNILSGIERPSAGRVLIGAADMSEIAPHRRAESVGRSFQVARLVPQMTVLENVAVRADQVAGFASEAARLGAARAQLDRFGLGASADMPVSALGSGYHKLIELARAAVGEPALLLLDEPAVGLAPDEIDRLCELLTLLKTRGAGILIVEHNVELVARIAERIFVMNQGRIIAAGAGPEVMANPEVRQAYLGALE
jgi:branched-chain amino acid transport system permease protein